MSPAIGHGGQVVVNPAIPVRPGVDWVFVAEQTDASLFAMVKRLLRSSPEQWKVRQYSPTRDFELSRKKWPRAHVISEIRRGGVWRAATTPLTGGCHWAGACTGTAMASSSWR